ncbi:MAG: V-type ATP synthase subunit A, partial [Meiothermus silvanus]|nr:V-type ATP synthase subunit A [Allomeiothermus silvanus]
VNLYKTAEAALQRGATIADFLSDPVIEKMGRARYVPEAEFPAYKAEFDKALEGAFKVKA